MIITFQEFEKHEHDRAKWLGTAIAQYMRSDEYKLALEADLYEKQQNTRIKEVDRLIYDMKGNPKKDYTKINNQIPSNFFHRLITQRVSYSLGNGVSFASKKRELQADQSVKVNDPTKDELGNDFDDIAFRVGYNAVKHGVCYCFYNDGEYFVFPMTEFLPFLDEETGKIRAGDVEGPRTAQGEALHRGILLHMKSLAVCLIISTAFLQVNEETGRCSYGFAAVHMTELQPLNRARR